MDEKTFSLPSDIRFGTLSLTVSDLSRALAFYQTILGFEVRSEQDRVLRLGLPGGGDLLELHESPGAQLVTRRTGLYHFALLLPDRVELAHALYRLLSEDYQPEGYADHLVSEAIYLSDPDGNGIELYRDRPRSEWPFVNGELGMSNAHLDVRGLLAELDGQPERGPGLHPETIIGHLHLRVADLPAAEQFYTQQMGFDLMQHYGQSAAFVSAGGYHHHLGMNTWESRGAPPLPPGSVGLRYLTLLLPTQTDLEALLAHLRQSGAPVEEEGSLLQVQDPSGNRIRLAHAEE